MKIPKQYRFSKFTLNQLNELARWLGEDNQTRLLEIAVDRLHTQERNKRMETITQMTAEEIEEQLRQLEIADGDEEVEHPDTQFSDYDETEAK